MSRLKIDFETRGNSVSLIETAFFHPSFSKEMISVRGSSSISGSGTFQWTNGVKALSLLFLNSRLFGETNEGEIFFLEGGSGSHASSLDYAISKEPLWLLDLFGVSASGHAMVRSIIRRYNSNLKRPGPVRLSISNSALPWNSITITLDKKVVQSKTEILSMIENIEKQCGETSKKRYLGSLTQNTGLAFLPASPLKVLDYAAESYPTIADKLKEIRASKILVSQTQTKFTRNFQKWCKEEITGELKRTENFNPVLLNQTVNRLTGNPDFVKLAGKNASKISYAGLSLTNKELMGVPEDPLLHSRLLTERKPIRISLTCDPPDWVPGYFFMS